MPNEKFLKLKYPKYTENDTYVVSFCKIPLPITIESLIFVCYIYDAVKIVLMDEFIRGKKRDEIISAISKTNEFLGKFSEFNDKDNDFNATYFMSVFKESEGLANNCCEVLNDRI
ncbi:MAG: hypothetical protein MJ213_01355 [Bacilli bacterium]|nr:hypothetical protein [Bacilli bacterium]